VLTFIQKAATFEKIYALFEKIYALFEKIYAPFEKKSEPPAPTTVLSLLKIENHKSKTINQK
jgi:hypothetical protein